MPDLPLPTPHNTSGVMDVQPASAPGSSFSNQPASEPPSAQTPPPRRRFAISFAIFATIAIALLAVAVLAYHWNRSQPHSSMIIVWGENDQDWENVVAVVSGERLNGELSAQLTTQNKLLVRFHVPEGRYTVKILKDGQVLKRKEPLRPNERHRNLEDDYWIAHVNLGRNRVWWPFYAPPEARRLNRT